MKIKKVIHIFELLEIDYNKALTPNYVWDYNYLLNNTSLYRGLCYASQIYGGLEDIFTEFGYYRNYK